MRRRLALVSMLLVLTGCVARSGGQGTAAGALPGALCPSAGLKPAAVVGCISNQVSQFWTTRLRQPVHEPIFVDPPPNSVPAECREFLVFGTAFFCTDNSTVYITHKAVTRDQGLFGPYLPWALATIISHEIGHVVQQTVDQPGFDDTGDAASRRIEQQADCLSGVWAHSAAAAGKLDRTGFVTVQRRELRAVSTLPTPKSLGGFNEVRTHGTVTQRVNALAKGLESGNPSSCGLVAR
jgi:hypothetical protein